MINLKYQSPYRLAISIAIPSECVPVTPGNLCTGISTRQAARDTP